MAVGGAGARVAPPLASSLIPNDLCHVHLAEKSWLKILFADLLLEKNIVRWLKKYGL
jgi:hypothetical protein